MAKIEVKFADAKSADKADVSFQAVGTVQVFTPAGQVFVSYDTVTGVSLVVVRGEKSTTAVKFNDKSVV
ncbi:hypothetical protein LCGC14_1330020 [marine sediment metagenome]|uniref:Uncharacterized protein n=1 Tax=marine sediment metagenome TaxID=412755 RepID=A0A0F9KGX7_9ZZZZ